MSREVAKRDELLSALMGEFRQLSAATIMFHQAVADRLGMNVTDHKCADILERHGPMTAGELAERTGLTTGAITGVIDRLEAAGFVRRARDPGDRRRVVVELDGPKFGQALSVVAEMVADMIAVQADYSDAELATVIEVLGKASAILRTHALTLRAETRAAG